MLDSVEYSTVADWRISGGCIVSASAAGEVFVPTSVSTLTRKQAQELNASQSAISFALVVGGPRLAGLSYPNSMQPVPILEDSAAEVSGERLPNQRDQELEILKE